MKLNEKAAPVQKVERESGTRSKADRRLLNHDL